MQLYIIEYESAHWAGASSFVLACANSEREAEEKTEHYRDEAMNRLYRDEYLDAIDLDTFADPYEQEAASVVVDVQVFDENHECWQFYLDPGQAEFYPMVD